MPLSHLSASPVSTFIISLLMTLLFARLEFAAKLEIANIGDGSQCA
jgi:hypothetical protein